MKSGMKDLWNKFRGLFVKTAKKKDLPVVTSVVSEKTKMSIMQKLRNRFPRRTHKREGAPCTHPLYNKRASGCLSKIKGFSVNHREIPMKYPFGFEE